jgi:hypothetical protein
MRSFIAFQALLQPLKISLSGFRTTRPRSIEISASTPKKIISFPTAQNFLIS